MPVHDWTRVDDGTFHHFHTLWIGEISKHLNRGVLPAGYYALAEQVAGSLATARQRSILIRHTSNHRSVALIEILSPGNKASEYAFEQLSLKIGGALHHQVHLLILDLQSLTLVSYEAGPKPNAYVEPVAVGQTLPDMPLFLAPAWHVQVPLEATYLGAWEGVPEFIQAILTQPPAA